MHATQPIHTDISEGNSRVCLISITRESLEELSGNIMEESAVEKS